MAHFTDPKVLENSGEIAAKKSSFRENGPIAIDPGGLFMALETKKEAEHPPPFACRDTR
ncbi:hypothetical protein [Marinovum sp.]|uniref:hypothetical protein n=1 Tax=Marinovum sp. TaxID=2024839 RepID=UPI002B267E34|nr:hypothetical protein [Marinovum sp.]